MTMITEQNHYNDLENIFGCDALREVPKRGIVHLGAHQGQEVAQYLRYGFRNIVLVEANPAWCEELQAAFGSNPRIRIFNYAVCDRSGMVDFHIHTSRSGSTEPASILPMKRFKEIVRTLHTTEVIQVPSITLEALYEQHGLNRADYNFLNIDIQGAELLALKGAAGLLADMDAIVSEVNLVELYDGGALEAEIVQFLAQHGFERKSAAYHTLYDATSTFPAWGECLFLRR
jgi:FkbM family methyltransferase